MLLSSGLGALIALSHRVWYPMQGIGAAGWGMTPLEDQQLAGLIMWVPGGVFYLVAVGILFSAWLNFGEEGRGVTAVLIDRPSVVR